MIGELVINLIILFASIYLFIVTGNFKQGSAIESFGAAFWPRLLLELLIILSVCQLIVFLKQLKDKESKQSSPLMGEKVMARTALIIAGYIFTISYIGFILASLLFVPIFLLNLGIRKVVPLIGTPVILTGFVYLLFIKVMYIPLPRGIGIFRLFSLIFY